MTKARDLADLISAGNPLADGTISVSEVSGAAPTASPAFTGDATFDTDTLVVDSTNNRVGVGTSSPATNLTVTSATSNGSGGDNEGMIQAYYTGTGNGNASLISKNYYGIMQFMAWESNGLRIGSRAVANGGSGEVVFTAGNDSEKFRIGSSGELGINGANYGTSGQVLKSNGSGAAPSWGEGGASTGKAIAMAIVFG